MVASRSRDQAPCNRPAGGAARLLRGRSSAATRRLSALASGASSESAAGPRKERSPAAEPSLPPPSIHAPASTPAMPTVAQHSRHFGTESTVRSVVPDAVPRMRRGRRFSYVTPLPRNIVPCLTFEPDLCAGPSSFWRAVWPLTIKLC